MSISLFAPYNADECKNRIVGEVEDFMDNMIVNQVPNCINLCKHMSEEISMYIEEVARCNGQESRQAREFCYSMHDQMMILSIAGIILDDWIPLFHNFVRGVLFDELRRCGIGKYDGSFEDEYIHVIE